MFAPLVGGVASAWSEKTSARSESPSTTARARCVPTRAIPTSATESSARSTSEAE